ncbi:MAG: response regulator, partial [Muribaculaceae bacterium]|nr:response regulator [Muribaculaceae bacterium]
LVKVNPRTGEARQVTSPQQTWDLWHIHSLTEYSPTTLLVGSDSGLTLVETATGACKVYKADELDPQSLSDRFVYPVTKDSDGGIWVGTYYHGVNYVSAGSQRFRSWKHSRFVNSMSGNVVMALCEDGRGNIWIGTADGGLCVYDPENDSFRDVTLINTHEPENVSSLCADDGRLWVGTYSMGAGWLDLASGRWTPVSLDDHRTYSCYAIHKDSKGRVWMGATETFTLYNPEKNSFAPVKQMRAWINAIVEDKAGRIWVSTPGDGLYRYDADAGTWAHYVASKAPGSLPNNHINSIKIDSTGEVLVTTSRGVYKYEEKSDRFHPVSGELNKVSAQSLERVGEDLWIATSAGLINLKSDGRYKLYGIDHGLSDSQFMAGASVMTADGKLYFGTVHGLSRVDPMQLLGRNVAPTVKFTGLDIVNEPVAVGDEHLPKSLNDIDELVLTHADHTFSVYFSALSYANPAGNSYQYRLEGFDKTWLDAGKENRATYSNLPPGTYTLRVKAANSDGIWNEEGVALKIVVKPAWYISTLMKFLYVILGIALLLLAVKLILKRIERNHIVELDRISSNKEKEMFRSKLNFFTIVAHEIRTPVSLIIGPLEKILESSEKFSAPVKEDLKIIDRNARRLLSLVNQLLDFKKVEDNALPMGFRHERVVPLVEGVADRFRPSLEHKGVKLTVECPDPDLTADIDPEAITKLVSNLLNNARKFTKDSIVVECKPMPDGKRFMISVVDNGIGIEKENRDKIFKPFFQVLDNINESKGGTGLGLSIVKSVADAHGGSIELDSTPGKGSRFTAILPLHQENVLPSESNAESVKVDKAQSPVVRNVSGDEKPVLLVVDDNEEMIHFISSHFGKNYKVVTATNGREAWECMGKNQVGLIICDWMMPVMDGVEFLKALRENENYSHIPFVMLTAKTDNTSKVESMRCGADAYVEKPFSMSYLEARIDNLLEMRKRLRDKYSHSPLEPISTLAPTQVDNELLTRLQELIEEHLANPELNVDFLAEQLGISRSGLYDKIKSLADVTPHELIQLTRLKKAAEYLAEGKYRVQEVSYMVGISNSSYFSRLFQKQFGVRPSEFHK